MSLPSAVQELLGAAIERVDAMPGGHIHRSYVAHTSGARYVVQRLNTDVFPDPQVLTRNVALVAATLLDGLGYGVTPVAGPDGSGAAVDAAGQWWRAFPYLEGTVAADQLPRSPELLAAVAERFGQAALVLEPLGDALTPTIERFHDLRWRLEQLALAAAGDRMGRAAAVEGELGSARRLAGEVLAAVDAAGAAAQERVQHNDAKLANALVERSTGRIAIVDLDTTFASVPFADLGELLRTGAHASAEDHPVPTEVHIDRRCVEALVTGYERGGGASGAGGPAPGVAGAYLAVENGVRFLADHLDGDRYFGVQRAGQNLDRCRVQLEVAAQLL